MSALAEFDREKNKMARRKKTKKEIADTKAILGRWTLAERGKTRTDIRLNVSMVFLIAILSISAYFLLFSIIQNGKASFGFGNVSAPVSKIAAGNSSGAVSLGKNQFLNDPALDFKLAIPSQFGQWMYRVGDVKGLTDDSLTNQFVKIYTAVKPTGSSTSFDECFKDVLTIRKFSTAEWKELEKGCGKGNLLFCEGAGTKINEKDGSVWAYTKSGDCSKETKGNCTYIEKVIGSFEFK